MNKYFKIWGLILFVLAFIVVEYDFCKFKISSLPYITGDTFKEFCDFVYEPSCGLDVKKIKNGDLIYVDSDYNHLDKFFEFVHPKIPTKYFLLTSRKDNSVPSRYLRYLEDPKIICWFGVNPDINFHPKFFSIPLGIGDRYFNNAERGDFYTLSDFIKSSRFKNYHNLFWNEKKTGLLYMNFGPSHSERKLVYNLFKDKGYCFKPSVRKYRQYLFEMSNYKFVLSPRGNGLDCYRTWEALLVGTIPVVRTSFLDVVFEDLPVLIVKDWNELTEDFLNKKYEEMSSKNYAYEKIYAKYWLDKIKNILKKYKN